VERLCLPGPISADLRIRVRRQHSNIPDARKLCPGFILRIAAWLKQGLIFMPNPGMIILCVTE
jgi:hypothetical protein